jgi:hypothetical protein
MIDDTIPAAQLPRYTHPDTGAPWFACPACSSTHVRAQRLLTRAFGMNAVVTTVSQFFYCRVPGSDRALDLEFGRSYDETPRVDWLACGACAHVFRVDGAALDLSDVYDTWDVVEDDDALAALGFTLFDEVDPHTDACLVPLRGAAEGERVGSWLLELLLADGPWLDQEMCDDTTGVNIHPGNYGLGVPDWCTAPYDADTHWPGDALFDESAGVRLAYSYDPESLPTFGQPVPTR